MSRHFYIILTIIWAFSASFAFAQSDGVAWPAADALNRSVETADVTGETRAGKTVGIFYFLWLSESDQKAPWNDGPYDVTKILAQLPEEERNDPELSRSELWGGSNHAFFWGEPLFGYYSVRDPWVLRRHMTLLADAGVDFLIFDTTNAVTYPESFIPLCEMLETIRAEGGKTPQITFMLNTEAGKTAEKLWTEIYGTGRFDDLLFRLDGKPLLVGDPAQITSETIRENLTLRRAHWPFEMVNTQNAWHWEAAYPQPYGWSIDENTPEQVNVSVAQNLRRFPDAKVTDMSSGYARGRSFCGGKLEEDLDTDTGRNFAEQWTRAYELDPPIVMITGWNEWIAGRWPRDDGKRMVFVDQFNREYSRDIEPMRSGHLDNYYLQMVDGIRRYKGAPTLPVAAVHAIDINGDFSQWADVAPELTDHRGETARRDFGGEGGTHYTNDTGRNDMIAAKITRDNTRYYFYVKTDAPILPEKSDGLCLLLDADGDLTTGFIGGDFLIGRAYGEKARLERFAGKSSDDWSWTPAGEVEYKIVGNELALAASFEQLGLSPQNASLEAVSFKWLDNFGGDNITPADLYTTGDVAPESRFFYRVKEQ